MKISKLGLIGAVLGLVSGLISIVKGIIDEKENDRKMREIAEDVFEEKFEDNDSKEEDE